MRSLSQSEIPPLPFLWTSGTAAREALLYLERKGISTEGLLSKAELSRGQVMQVPGGVSAASQHRFLELAAAEANDPLLGLHVAAEMDLRGIGLLYYLSASCTTVAEALEYFGRYAATTTEEIRLEISRQQDEVDRLEQARCGAATTASAFPARLASAAPADRRKRGW
jgi:Arabinose-binding domain of AraC transcription regulator, N-term